MTRRIAASWAWLALLVGLLAMAPGLLQRVELESRNTVWELAISNGDLTTLELGGVPLPESLDELTDAGLTTVVIDMQFFGDLEREGRVTLLDRGDLLSQLLLAGEPASAMPEEGDAFLLVAEGDEEVLDRIRRAARDGEIEPITVAGQQLFGVSGVESIGELALGYDRERVAALVERGVRIIPRVAAATPSVAFATEELGALQSEFGIDRFLLAGEVAPFTADPTSVRDLSAYLRDAGFTMVVVEHAVQAGNGPYIETVGRVVRLRMLGLAPDMPERPLTDAIRSVRERNVRILSLRANPLLEAEQRVADLTEGMTRLRELAPDDFSLGDVEPLGELRPSPLHLVGGVVAAVGVAGAAGAMIAPTVGLAFGALMALASIGMAVTGSTTAGDLVRLSVAILASLLAAWCARPRPGVASAAGQFGKAVLVAVAGGLVLAGLAHDELFLVAAREFRGVKALLIAPPLAAGAVAAYHSLGRPTLADAASILGLPVRLWHVIAFLAIAGAAGFMLLRSGNSGIQIDVELLFREQIETLFQVRPRTKEFLIGWPALLLGIVAAFHSRHGWWLYVLATVATASVIDTFAHFHTPLVISLLRTVYGGALGLVAGIIALAVARALVGPVTRLLLPPRA